MNREEALRVIKSHSLKEQTDPYWTKFQDTLATIVANAETKEVSGIVLGITRAFDRYISESGQSGFLAKSSRLLFLSWLSSLVPSKVRETLMIEWQIKQYI